METRMIHPTNMEALALHIAEDYTRHLRPQARQLKIFMEDDYIHLTGVRDVAWRSDVFVDDDYIFGAHVIVTHRKEPSDAINAYLESLFIMRRPPRQHWSIGDRPVGYEITNEFTTWWLDNEARFFDCKHEWYARARRAFMQWYTQPEEWHAERERREHERAQQMQWYKEWIMTQPITFDPKSLLNITAD